MAQSQQPSEGHEGTLIEVTLLSSLSGERVLFNVPATMQVSNFIHLILDTLSQGENGDQIQTMQRYYEPVLEIMVAGDVGHEVSPLITLAAAGFTNNSRCRLAAHPVKSEQLFCRHCG